MDARAHDKMLLILSRDFTEGGIFLGAGDKTESGVQTMK